MALTMPPEQSVLIFHHLGLLTSRPDSAADHLAALGYHLDTEVVDNLQKVRLRMGSPPGGGEASGSHIKTGEGRCFAGGPALELITPLPDNDSLKGLLKRRDDYIYHLCYTASSLGQALGLLSASGAGVTEISSPKPAVLFGGLEVSFYLIPGLGLIELIDLESGPDAGRAGTIR